MSGRSGGLGIAWWQLGNKTPKYLAAAEYWLYMSRPKLPPQAAYMQRMLRINPFTPGEQPPCGHNEGLIFSDIRFHIGLVLREKNVHIFRPDLFETYIRADSNALEQLAHSVALAKVQYVSDVPLKDDRHLQFLVYLVEALAHLTRSEVAFDVAGERMIAVSELREELRGNPDGKRPDLHLRTYWVPTEQGGRAVTRGLRKIGLPELTTPESSNDHESIIRMLLEDAAYQIWADRELRTERTLSAFGDQFQATIQFRKKEDALVRISRIAGH